MYHYNDYIKFKRGIYNEKITNNTIEFKMLIFIFFIFIQVKYRTLHKL